MCYHKHMRNDLKERRQLSYLMNDWDDINLSHMIDINDVPNQVIQFFKTDSVLRYPAKSYFVAIVYAKCLERYFGESFYESLNDAELLPDDMYFKPYENDNETYDKILTNIGDIWQYDSILKTVHYFKKEFLINGVSD